MSNQLSHLLRQWQSARNDTEWVLGTVYKTEGPCYRKAGAMMLMNGLGQQFGLLSGGCLESDIQTHARQVMQSGEARTLRYDGNDEDDISYRLGIGCGGTVHILLQPLDAAHDHLDLDAVHSALRERRSGSYLQHIPNGSGAALSRFVETDGAAEAGGVRLEQREGDTWLVTPILPDPHLLIVGGGLDAQPLAVMAGELGWEVTVCDPRPANARRECFLSADTLVRSQGLALADYARRNRVNAAVLMSHNMDIDADALTALQDVPLDYLALLGPARRRARVLEMAGLPVSRLPAALAGPAGLDIGAELPEGIALSILAECHAALKGRPGGSLSAILTP
ncbi:MAG: XdhC family protein [Candidatus Thiodiazotropha sp.]